MPVQVTLDIFSGRPNPTIQLSEREADELLGRAKPGRALAKSDAGVAPGLGYRGLIVEQVGRAARGLPRTFHVGGGRVFGEGLAHRIDDPTVEADFLGRPEIARKFEVRELTPEVLRKLVRRRFEAIELWRPIKLFPLKVVCPCAPVYEPAWWNDGGQRQWNNNCYNYGCNYRTDTFAQPGKANGAMYGAITGAQVKAGAIADALEDAPTANNKCPKSGHLVALVIWPNVDFHWYRKGLNGRWTHKPGGTAATNLDNSGALISDPRTADRGNYTQFTTFMVAKHGHTKIK
ncbi:MAG: hypothetical protein JNM80_09475 [Phycisphaerae bacterium]|nr:hypothetical protein [Phycisphaerae bacterium]